MAEQIIGPRTTASSVAEGRMRMDVGGIRKKKKTILKKLLKNC